jgi:hypothetical protein
MIDIGRKSREILTKQLDEGMVCETNNPSTRFYFSNKNDSPYRNFFLIPLIIRAYAG